MGLEGNFTCMARRSRVAFVLNFITDDERRTTILCAEDLRTIRATCGIIQSWDRPGMRLRFQAALVDFIRSVDTADKEDIVKSGAR